MAQDQRETKKAMAEMKAHIDEIKAGMRTHLSAQKDKEKITELGPTSSGIPQLPNHDTLPLANQPVEPRLADIDTRC